MRHMKKILSLSLAVLMLCSMAVAFTGCGKGAEWPTNEDGKTVLYIGGIGPLTGDYANYGTSVRNGAAIAVKEINESGILDGFHIELDYQDSQGDPESATAAYGKLMDSGMKVSLGAVLSGENAAVVAAAKEDGLLVLSPSASSVQAIADSEQAFRICFSDPAQGIETAKFISKNELGTKVAVFYAGDNDYSKGLLDSFKGQAATENIEIVTEQSFDNSTNTDFSAQINAIKDSGAELVFLPIYAAEASTFLTQAKGQLDGMTCIGCDGLDGLLTKMRDTADANGVIMLTPFAADSPDEKVQSFVSKYKEAYNNAVPDQFAADGYDAVYTVVEAMKYAGITPEDVSDFNTRIVEAMTKITVQGLTGKMTWAADGNTQKEILAMEFVDGKAVIFEK